MENFVGTQPLQAVSYLLPGTCFGRGRMARATPPSYVCTIVYRFDPGSQELWPDPPKTELAPRAVTNFHQER